MRDNAFDKGVQDKMGEFRLTPSAPVWPEVERRIRERRKRRILIFWFCLAGILVAGTAGWWLIQGRDTNKPITEQGNDPAVIPQLKPAKSNNKIDPSSSSLSGTSIENTRTDETSTASGNDNEQVKSKPEINQPQTKTSTTATAVAQKRTILRGAENKKDVMLLTGVNGKKSRNRAPVNRRSAVSAPPLEAQPAQNNSLNEITVSKAENKDKSAAVPVTVTATASNAEPVVIPAAKTDDSAKQQQLKNVDPVPPTATINKRKNNWQTGLVFAFGEARLARGTFNLFSAKSNFDALQSGVTTGNGNFNNQSFADSLPLKGTGVHAGVYFKRPVGKKTSFSAGLNLAYYSGKQRVGTWVDSVRRISAPFNTDTRSGYYRSGNSEMYTNRYYYVQLPLLLHWQLNKAGHWPPIEWENGFVPSLLIGSKALVYAQGSQLFFRDRTVYQSFSLVYQSGLTATLNRRSKHPLSAGVYYNYHLSRLQKVNPPDFNHQSSFGIQLRWLLKK